MKANLKANQTGKAGHPAQSKPGQSSIPSGSPSPPAPSNQAPSVPISVYRDLADELKATNHQVNLLTSQNEALRLQNETLRAEVIRVIESAAQLQRILKATADSPSTAPPFSPNHHPNPMPAPQPNSPPGKSRANASQPLDPSASKQVADAIMAELDQTLMAQLEASLLVAHSPKKSPATGTAIDSNQIQPKIYGPYCDLAISEQFRHDPQQHPALQPQNEVRETEPQFDPQLSWQALETEFLTEPATDILTTADPRFHGTSDSDADRAKPINGMWLTLTLVVVIVTAFSAGFLVVLPFIQNDGGDS